MNERKLSTGIEPLLRLFRSFRDQNDEAFRKAAESIISDELSANRHSIAKELRTALGTAQSKASGSGNSMSTLPRSRATSEQLLTIYHEPASTHHLFLSDETKCRIERVIDEKRNAGKLARHGYSPKSKLLFWGPPGCGKTLAAHHLANQFSLKVGVVRLSSLISSLLGDTSARIQQVFDVAQETPMVLLFDEIDAIAKTRDDVHDVGELKRVVNSLLQAMDTFTAKESILIGASNHQHMLDTAIWRRFDDVITFPKPNPELRTRYISHQLNGVSFAGSISKLVKETSGLSFAEIEHALVEAVKTMILADRKELSASDVTAQLSYQRKMLAATKKAEAGLNE